MSLPTPYERALAEARRRTAAIDERTARLIEEALERASDRSVALFRRAAAASSGLPAERAIAATEALRTRALAALRVELEEAIGDAIEQGVSLTNDDIREVWTDAMEQYGAGLGQSASFAGAAPGAVAEGAALGGLSLPAIQQAAVATRITPGLLRTTRETLPRYIEGAARDIDFVIREAIVDRVSPDQLAKALRPYIREAQAFDQAFGAQAFERMRDLRKGMPPQVRDAARQMKYKAERIAFTEIQQARVSAEANAFDADPFVRAVRWQRSSNRGRISTACGCDVLATADLHGLGPGVYPTRAVPPSPHPWCRCERVPITVDIPLSRDQKPRGVDSPSAAQAVVPTQPEGDLHPTTTAKTTTPASADRARLQAQRALDIAAASAGGAP